MANLVSNPGFETIDGPNNFADWTELIAGIDVFDNTTFPYTGDHAAQLGLLQPPLPPIAAGIISQTITGLTPGNTYTLSFYAASFDIVGLLAVSVTSILLTPWLSINVNINILTGSAGYTLHTFQFEALDTAAILSFSNIGLSVSLIDDVSVILSAICYSGQSLVYAKNIETNEIGYIEAKNIYSDKHEVYSVNEDKFIPVKLNVVTGPVKQFRLIKKDAFGENTPNADFYVTSGHPIVLDGQPIKAGKVPEAKRFNLTTPEYVYSICVDGRQPILINNLPVMAWDHEKWLTRVSKKIILWKNNVAKSTESESLIQ